MSATVEPVSTEVRDELPAPDSPAAGGFRELIVLALPLVLSSGTQSLMHITDRLFLTAYSSTALAASLPAGILFFTCLAVPFGLAMQLNAFVAQYVGARQHRQASAVVWQGLMLTAVLGGLLSALGPFADSLFLLLGHPREVALLEAEYFRWLCAGAIPALWAAVLSSFFSGRGDSTTVLMVNIAAVGVNVALDYVCIFGWGPVPRLGVAGAAIATSLSALFQSVAFAWLACRPHLRRDYQVLQSWRYDGHLMGRVLWFGLPAGVHLLIDVAAWTAFILLIGQIGQAEGAATNIAFNLNTLAFIPIVGLGIAVSTLVGQRLGENRPDIAEKSVYTAFYLGGAYMIAWSLAYALLPDLLIAPYAWSAAIAAGEGEGGSVAFEQIHATTVTLLKFVAIYSFFDAMVILFGAAIRAAGDTRFAMFVMALCGSLCLLLPTALVWHYRGPDLWLGWTIATSYMVIIGFIFYARFVKGPWRSMRLVETVPID